MEIKVFIVDDEERQRHSIVRHVDWQRYGMRVTGEWEDAASALAGAAATPPDLLITDIRLIGTDGLELSARMKEGNPQLSVIMVTGYEEFQYAKTAVDLGVEAFLVKPIIFAELGDILERIREAKQAELTKRQEAVRLQEQLAAFRPIAEQQWLQEVLHGLIVGDEAIRAQAQAFGLFSSAGPRRVLSLLVSADRTSPLAKDDQMRQAKAHMEEAAEAVCGALLEARLTSERGHIVLILHGGASVDFEAQTERCLARLIVEIGRLPTGRAHIGVGPAVERLNLLAESFRLAQRAVNQSLLGGEEQAYSWRLLPQPEAGSAKSVEELTADFFEMAGAGDAPGSLSLLGELLGRMADGLHPERSERLELSELKEISERPVRPERPNRVERPELQSLCMHLISGTYRAAAEVGDVGRSFGAEQKLWEQTLACRAEVELLQETVHILKGLIDFMAERKKTHTQAVVQRALEYMNTCYADNLSLRSVAEWVFLSPSYLGALFRAELGISFTDQLILIRIGKAKELLRQPQLKLYEVAERVGYQNIGYFTNVFKRITGNTPKEYRDIHGYLLPE